MASRLASHRAAARDRGPLRPVLAALAALAVAAFAAGCVSMPGGGPVLSYPVTQGPDAQSQPFLQMYLGGPGNGWTPEEVVTGFLTASGSFANGQQVAREYLTPQFSHQWHPGWSATVYSNGPSVSKVTVVGTGSRKQATVTVAGRVQASLSGAGSYAVPSAKEQEGQPPFNLVQVNGQWRISSAPQKLLLTSDLFKFDYQLRNLYFFDPTGHFLVPDPVYVPQLATSADLMNQLVRDLIRPPSDWLSDATDTAFPLGTNLSGDVTLDGGTATVNLSGAIAKLPARSPSTAQVMEQVSAQLLWTLSGSGQGGSAVQSVEVSLNSKPWIPSDQQSDENPIQHQVNYSPPTGGPPTGGSSVFYYLDRAGNLRSFGTQADQAKSAKVAHIGTGYSQIAVSPDGQYLAALRNGSLFIGPTHGRLSKRESSGYTTMSWDPADNLWATTSGQIVMLRGAASPRQPLGQPVSVNVVPSDGISPGPVTAVRVAPDGVRVAIIVANTDLYFGAIVPARDQPGARTGQTTITIALSPFHVVGTGTTTFSSVTWYGPDNVITLGGPGPVLTEYPVDGGTSTSIPAESGIQSITASFGSALIAGGLAKGGMLADASLTGSWMPIKTAGISPVYPG